ncbi:MAG: diaminopropionate ammonia-lyase [Lachnospiraceae bacterium]|nr:diaminopropionate ammonia-lyase [Candidatus Equihabitans merdae]
MNLTNNEEAQFTLNNVPESADNWLNIMSVENVSEALQFHKSFPEYKVTPLTKLENLAGYLGIDSLYVKDESFRFGLNAFKVLGGSYAIAKYISKQTGIPVSELDYISLSSPETQAKVGQTTFYTATDGNHGRGIAWSANKLGQKSVVRMPHGSSEIRRRNIAKYGADVTIEDLNYDDCVKLANDQAKADPKGVLVQDQAFRGYTDIPAWIMTGYGTLALEADRQMIADGCDYPTHIFVQAGVGSLAGAVVGYFANKYKDHHPTMCVVEAGPANCIFRSAKKADGKMVRVRGKLDTIMAGLACGQVNPIGWDILRNHAAGFASCPDWMSAMGTRIYGVPLDGDKRIISGESGSVTMGYLWTIMMDPDFKDVKEALGLNEKSRVLLVSTEGNTDPVRFREVVWNGLYGIRHRGEAPIK